MFTRSKFYAVFFFFLSVLYSPSQSLNDLQKNLFLVNGKEKVDLYLKIGNILSEKFGKPDSLLYYANQAYNEAGKLNYSKGQQMAIYSIAIAYQKKGKCDTSIAILKKLSLGLKNDNDLSFKGDINYNLGLNYRIIDNFKLATEYYLEAISDYEKAVNFDGIALATTKLAGIFTLEKQFDLALLYARKAAAVLPKMTNPLIKVTVLSGFSALYTQVATSDSTMIDSAIYYAKAALSLSIKHEYYTKGNQLCLSISNGFLLKKNYRKALEYCHEAMKYRNYLYDFEIIMSYLNFSDSYFGLKNYKSSLTYLDSAQMICTIFKDPFYEMRIAERAYEYNKAAGNVRESERGFKRFIFLKDSLFSAEKSAEVNAAERKYYNAETDKKVNALNEKNEISILKNKYLIAGIVMAIIIILIIIFFYRQSLLKNKLKMMEAEERLNRARMDPHFFFNSLASLQSLSMDEGKNKEVSDYIHRFSKIMRESLESTFKELNTIEKEIEFLTHYLELQKLRSDNKFVYEFKIDDKLETNELLIPGMILQPFIENSIEHGFAAIQNGGLIRLEFVLLANELKIIISDNGSSKAKSENHKGYESRATQIIKDRLFLLNKKHKTKAIFEVRSSATGTIVQIHLPILRT